MFDVIECFQTNGFKEFRESMRTWLAAAENNNPSEAKVDAVLPGVNQRLNNVVSEVRTNGVATTEEAQACRRDVFEVKHQGAQQQVLLHGVASAMVQAGYGVSGDSNDAAFQLVPGNRMIPTVARPMQQPALPAPRGSTETPFDARLEEARRYIPPAKLNSLQHAFDQWYGLGRHEGPPDGIAQWESLGKKAVWRKHFKPSVTKRLPRLKQAVELVDKLASERTWTKDAALSTLEPKFAARGVNCSIDKLRKSVTEAVRAIIEKDESLVEAINERRGHDVVARMSATV